MAHCGRCGTEIASGARFCTSCGEPVAQVSSAGGAQGGDVAFPTSMGRRSRLPLVLLTGVLTLALALGAWWFIGRNLEKPGPGSVAASSGAGAPATPCLAAPANTTVEGTGTPLGRAATSGGAGTTQSTVVSIGVVAPLSGSLASLGAQILSGAQAAVDDANANEIVSGASFTLVPFDDEARGERGAAIGVEASSSEVVGLVGPLNSSVALELVPRAPELPIISPSTSNPRLTRGEEPGAPKRPSANYFRTVGHDGEQALAAARHLCNVTGASAVATVADEKTYGSGLVRDFTAAFTGLGGRITTAEQVSDATSDFGAIASKVVSSQADAVYFGGEYPQGQPLIAALRGAGFTGPVMSGDGMYDPKAGASEGDMATSLVVAPELVPALDQRLTDSYEASSYDAAAALILAYKAAGVPNARRADVLRALPKVSFAGVTGPVSFNSFGDRVSVSVTVATQRGSEWVPTSVLRVNAP